MKNRILIFAIFASLVFSSSLVSASLPEPKTISSEGSIVYPALQPLRVDGKRIVDALGNQVILRGFNLWSPNIFTWQSHPLLSPERFQEIENWEFNSIAIVADWSDIERNAGQVGVYSEANLARMEEIVEWLQDAGLYAVITLRVIHHWWDQETTLNYMLTPEGWTRFGNMLDMVVQRFDHYENVIGFNAWHFPFHGWDDPAGGEYHDPAWEDSYYNDYTPLIINTIRAHSNKIIFYSLYRQAYTQGVDTRGFRYITPIADDNVVYCHNLHGPRDVERNQCVDWDYYYAEIDRNLQDAFDFSDQYNVPCLAVEFGLAVQGESPAGDRPIKQSRLDCLDYKLQVMDEQGDYNWLYWLYGNDQVPEGVLEADNSPNAVLYVLRNHVPA